MTSVYRVGRFLSESENLKIIHRLYRGLDERDGALALSLGVEFDFKAFEIFNITSESPFSIEDLTLLKINPKQVIINKMPHVITIYEKNGWSKQGSLPYGYT